MNSPDFDSNWLEERITSFPEGVFLDFKIEPPVLEEKDDDHFTFAKHLIAFGNMARSTGRECHIVFGVDDKTRQTKDLRNFYHPANLKEWDSNTSIQTKQGDGVEARIRQITEKWIMPEILRFSLKFGEIRNGVFLSYLVISPTKTSVPFYLRKPHKSRSAGTVFVRVCSSSVPIQPSEIENLLSFSEIEYLSRSEWQRFFQFHSAGEFLKAHELLPTFDHRIKDGDDALETVVKALDEGKQTILIKGMAGAGKSTLLRRLAYRLSYLVDLVAEIPRNDLGESDYKPDDETFIVTSFKDEMSNLPKSRIPVYMSLRKTFQSIKEIDDLLLVEIQKIVGESFSKLDGFLKNNNISWVILLDGVDEIRNRGVAGPIFGEWLQLQSLSKNVQVVITSRPYTANPDAVSFVIELATLQPKEILFLMKGKMEAAMLLQNENAVEHITPLINSMLKFMEDHPEFFEFVNRHRAIDGLLEYLVIPAEPVAIDDTPRVLVEAREETILSENNTGSLPVIGLEDQLQSDRYFDGKLFGDGDSVEDDRPIKMVELLYIVYRHLRTAEVIRQREWGHESEAESEDAAYELSRAAWNGSWQTNELNVERAVIDRSFLEWNQFAGFVMRIKKPRFQYCCDLFQQFLIAEYGYENKNEEMESAINEHGGLTNARISKIAQLYDEFSQWRGQEPLSLQQ